jgi:hypothetical protein
MFYYFLTIVHKIWVDLFDEKFTITLHSYHGHSSRV